MIDNLVNCTAFMSLSLVSLGIYFCLLMSAHGSIGALINADMLNVKILGTPLASWPITHFVFYAAAAYNFPTCWPWILSLGLVWECVEWSAQQVTRALVLPATTQKTTANKTDAYYDECWWSASIIDLLANNAGVLVGLLINKYTQ